MFDLCLLRRGVLDYGSFDFVRRSAFSQQIRAFRLFRAFCTTRWRKKEKKAARLDGSFSALRWSGAYSKCKKRRDNR